MSNKIYDCITFFDEPLQANLRFNILNNCVEKFIVCESKFDHKGQYKGINFNIENYKDFKDKIIHLVIEEQFPDTSNPWKTQAFQREFIFNGLNNAKPEDFIMFSDPDEIPHPETLASLKLNKKYGIFLQKMYCYKINVYNPHESPWEGSRISLKKNLKSIDFLRQKILKKNTRYPFWRIDKEKSIQLIENGGWHFNYLSEPEKISRKLKTFAHTEYNKDKFTNIGAIKNNINEMRDLFNKGYQYYKVQLDNTFPDYILNNQNKFYKWIKQ
jgi:beta-1,4-mannosyl-glycoprotein beta-1,4-N-acetylglucosaminyltransferase